MSDKQCVQTHTMQFGFARAADCDSVPVYNVMYGTTCSLQKSNVCLAVDSSVMGEGYGEVGSAFLKCSEIPT
jgi:hypothetical protein